MAGFNFELGRSNNMVAAEDRGMITVGRWGRRYKVSAAAVEAVMKPSEAHHTGTGRRGKSRLTYVIAGSAEPTAEQMEAMKAFDSAAKPARQAKFAADKAKREKLVAQQVAEEAYRREQAAIAAERSAVLQPLEKRNDEKARRSMPPEPRVRKHRLDGEDRKQMEERRAAEYSVWLPWEIEKNRRAAEFRAADEELQAAYARFYPKAKAK